MYLCILHLIHGNVIFDISLNYMLFKNIALFICVFVRCARCAQDVCKSRYMQGVLNMCARCAQDVRKMCARIVQDVLNMCSRCMQDVRKLCARCVQDAKRNLRNLVEF